MQLNTFIDIEKQYIEALKQEYEHQVIYKECAKLRYVIMARRIQRCFKKYKKQRKEKALHRIHKFLITIMRETRYRKQKVQKLKSIFYSVKVKYILRRKMRFRRSELLLKQGRDYSKCVKQLRTLSTFIRRFKILQKLRRRKFKMNFYFRVKLTLLQKSLMDSYQRHQCSMWGLRMSTQVQRKAIQKEMEFMRNVIETNHMQFEQNWVEYERSLTRFLDGRNRTDDWLEQDGGWINIKTLSFTTLNPHIREKQQTLARIRKQALAKFQDQCGYLNESIHKLEELDGRLCQPIKLKLSENCFKDFFKGDTAFVNYFRMNLKS